MKYIINYYNKNGQRSSLSLTSKQKEAMELLCKRHGFNRLQDYVYYVIDCGLGKDVGVSTAVKDKMFAELIE